MQKVPGWQIQIDEHGNMYNMDGKQRTPSSNYNGFFGLMAEKDDGTTGKLYQHRAYHNTFIYDAGNEGIIEFINGDRSDLSLHNLRLVDYRYAAKKAAKNRKFKGAAISSSKVKTLKKEYRSGMTQPQLARKYGVSTRTIRRYLNGI